MKQQIPSDVGLRGGVKEPAGVNAVGTVLQLSVTDHVLDVTMTMLPDQWNALAIVVHEGVVTNHSAIRATKVVLGGPARKVRLCHFDLLCEF